MWTDWLKIDIEPQTEKVGETRSPLEPIVQRHRMTV